MIENIMLGVAIFIGILIMIMMILIFIRINKRNKETNRKSRESAIDFMRKTSKHNKPERKRLKF